MINVCLDWNCIMALEEERKSSPALRQIREWYKQGKIVLCISKPSRMENHQSRDKRFYDEKGWNEKLRGVDLEGIELRSSKERFLDSPGLEQVLIREIHNRLFPNFPFLYRDYAQDQNVELPEPHGVFFSFPQSLQEELERENDEQRHLARKWNNKKNDALSIHAYATWCGPDDVFVTDDGNFLKNREKLQAPYTVKFKRPAEVLVHGERMLILQENLEEIPGHIVIPGQILDPQQTVEYLRKRLEE